MKKQVREGKASLSVFSGNVVSKNLPVFYNPVMTFNRDMSVLLLRAIGRKGLRVAEPLAGSGVRGMRFLTELQKIAIKHLAMNDASPQAVKLIAENLSLNGFKVSPRIAVHNTEASKFLLGLDGFDYIDVDPFGSPNPFLDAAAKKLARGGVLAVTATDTGALCGTYPKACRRKYWAEPKKGPLMHETGLRILIRKVQLVGMQYDKALTPIVSYSKDHYMRVFFSCEKGRTACDGIARQHGMFGSAGPFWLGALGEEKLLRKIVKLAEKDDSLCEDKEKMRFILTLASEVKVDTVGFHDLHALSRQEKFPSIPSRDAVKEALAKKGYRVSDTHFSGKGMRSDASEKVVLGVMRRLSKKN